MAFAWAIRSAQEAHWAPLDGGSIVGSFQVLPREAESRLHAGVPQFSRLACGSGGPCPSNVLFDQSMSRRSEHVPSVQACPLEFPISIEFSSALNRGRERVFCPNLSPFSHRYVSSLNRGERSSCPIPLPTLELLLSSFLFAKCVHMPRWFLSERG